MQNIKLDLPYTAAALVAASRMLAEIAGDLTAYKNMDEIARDSVDAPEAELAILNKYHEDPEPAAEDPEPAADPNIDPEPAPAPAEDPAPAPGPTIALDVDLDEAGLPWDSRIHASTKTKLARGNTWKYKRNTPNETIAAVEAELRAAMAAAPPASSMFAPEAEDPAPAPAPAATTTAPAPAPAPAATEGAVVDFPGLMKLITVNKIDQATVLAAVKNAGLASLQLVAARKDLIPQIAAELAQ